MEMVFKFKKGVRQDVVLVNVRIFASHDESLFFPLL